MMRHNELRLLPWSSPDGKPCFLSTDDTGGPLSRLADHAEATQLHAAVELLEYAAEALANVESDPEELRLLATDLTTSLREVLRVATSRGRRLPAPDHSPGGGDDATPRLPASAFG
ncbi:hypothetical protein [Streptomyces sp. NPDC004788]